jgi:hypothetical protein
MVWITLLWSKNGLMSHQDNSEEVYVEGICEIIEPDWTVTQYRLFSHSCPMFCVALLNPKGGGNGTNQDEDLFFCAD